MSNYRVTRGLVRFTLCLSLSTVSMSLSFAQQEMPQTADGKPDFSGLWQAMGSAHWNIEPSAAKAGPDWQWGALGAIPATLGVVHDGELPYTPSALAQRQVKALVVRQLLI
jgi:hypothetical protein